ncbi:hypothetical protein QTG54_000488 [Skeletonema marinoi]|uniref:Sfi1 spindle body domain-containing protein n=1 Tax=Skeletonema marinoi TaxID=267567 RepID=A0AAD8YN73_9STRA|nr:hypothetical protein QTG54_000488 [Skeletonema marinoi]
MSRTSFGAYEEGKDCSTWDEKIDWSRSGNFTFASPVSSSESEAPPPPPTDDSDSSYSTFAEHVPSSSSSSIDKNDDIDDGATNRQFEGVEVIGALTLLEGHEDDIDDAAAAKCDEDGILSFDRPRSYDIDMSYTSSNDGQLEDVDVVNALNLLEGYEEGFNNDDDDSVEVETSGNNALECFNVILGRFATRCALDHWKCMTTKETEKCKQMQRQQACLQLLQTLLKVKVRHSLLLWSHSINRIAWQENAVGAFRQRNLGNAFRSWRDVTKASKMRRQVYFLMMIFNRWRVLTEESVATRQKKYAALMHWAERLTRKSFSVLKVHAVSQREEREHSRGSYQPRHLFRSSLRSPEQSFANSTPDYTNQLSFRKSAQVPRFSDQESRYRGSGFASSRESFTTAFQSISPSARTNKHRFQELGSSRTASHSSSYHSTGRRSISSEMLHNSRRMSLSQPYSSHPTGTSQDDQDKFAIPFGCAADDIV